MIGLARGALLELQWVMSCLWDKQLKGCTEKLAMSGLTSRTTIHLQARMYRKRFRGPKTLEPLQDHQLRQSWLKFLMLYLKYCGNASTLFLRESTWAPRSCIKITSPLSFSLPKAALQVKEVDTLKSDDFLSHIT